MKTFSQGDRVIVVEATRYDTAADTIRINAPGTVDRVRTDGNAWVKLDKRNTQGGIHPFSDEVRSNLVLAHPEHCKPARKNHKERQQAKRNDRVDAQPEPTIEMFGKDHWSTFGYIETRIVDHGGRPDRVHMRCDASRHPLLAAAHHREGGKKYPTRLAGEVELEDHDDWDCVDDLMRVGLLENVGTFVNPIYRLTDEGKLVAGELRAHKGENGSFGTFKSKRAS